MAKKKEKPATSKSRQPVVAILGHVDHGKTTLLDYIRKTRQQAKEVGGITQSIGAYQAEFKGKKITFIDTPGHAAFSKMRSQGAEVADIVVLVIAADDGVKPQTIESIKHIQNAKVSFLVALTKTDTKGANSETVKAQLTEHEVFVDGYGGNTPLIEVSAKEGKNIDNLLENILLLSELEELPLEPNKSLQAIVIEAQKDMRKGIVVSVIIKRGTLKIGDTISTKSASAKVKALYNDLGQTTPQVMPGEPAQILGFKQLPYVGEIISSGITTTSDPQDSKQSGTTLPEETQPETLKIILKADTLGSLEAIKNSLSDEVRIIHDETGDVSESDILLASTTGSIVLGFNSNVSPSVKKLAEIDKVIVNSYQIIYELLEYVEKKVLHILEPTTDEEDLGEAEILKIFDFNKNKIAGCKVLTGELKVGDTIHLKREGEILEDAHIKSLQKGKEQVQKVKTGDECGILLSPQLDITEKDIILSYNKNKEEE